MSLTPKFGQISEVAQALVPLCCFTEGILTGFCFSMRYPLWMATATSRCRSQPTFVSSELMPSLLLLFHVTGASGISWIFFLEEKMENAQDFGGTCKWVKRGLPLVFTLPATWKQTFRGLQRCNRAPNWQVRTVFVYIFGQNHLTPTFWDQLFGPSAALLVVPPKTA